MWNIRFTGEAGKGTVQPSMVKRLFKFTAQSEDVLNIWFVFASTLTSLNLLWNIVVSQHWNSSWIKQIEHSEVSYLFMIFKNEIRFLKKELSL